jgi:SAM-dependent methyltransferase
MSTPTAAAAHWDQMYATATRSAWTQNGAVAEELYRRMTGHNGFWLHWVFNNHLPVADHVLSIGCGDGSHELMIGRQKFAGRVTAFDASPVAIAQASAIAEQEGLPIDFQVRLFEEFVSNPGPDDLYDCVLFSGSLHHVTDLEGMLSAVRKVLRPGGAVIVNEYCGPCYQLYPTSQVELVNRVLDGIPPQFRMGPDERLILPTIEMIMASDPTEGVRSALIPALVPMYFTRDYERFLGGGLLHPIFGYLNGSKVNDGSPESVALVDMLIVMEKELTAAGVLAHDFMFGIYRN